jgi:sugar phosphate isomerase/epimerase
MHLGFCTALYDLDLPGNLAKSKELGFSCLEVNAWTLFKRDKFEGGRNILPKHLEEDSVVDEIDQAIKDTGIYICCVHGPMQGVKLGDPDFDDKLYLYEALLERMKRLNIKYLLHHAGNGNLGDFQEGENKEMWKAIVGSLEKLRDLASSHGITLTVENGAGAQDLTHPKALRKLFDALDGVFFSCDVQHAYRPQLWDYDEMFGEVGDRLVHLHVPDGDGFISHGGIPGKCFIDWPHVMKLIRRTGFDGPATIETDLRAFYYILGYYLAMMKEEGIEEVYLPPVEYAPPNEYRYGPKDPGHTKLTPRFVQIPSAHIRLTDRQDHAVDIHDAVILTAKKQLERLWAESE